MTQVVDTNGWDTVAAITYADVNMAIAAKGSGPPEFTYAAPDGSASMQGSFGPWQLTTGGAGPLLVMSLPITSGKVTIGDQAHDVTPCTALVEISATFIPASGTQINLVPAGKEPASVQAVTPPQSSFLVNAALSELLAEWLRTNMDKFNAVFASVDLDAAYDNEGVSWLKPSVNAYAVAEPSRGATLENSVFGVLCLIDGAEELPGMVWQISPFAIPDGSDAAFIIAEQKFLQHMMLVAMPAMFKGLGTAPATDNFVIDNMGTRIRSTNPLTLLPVTLTNKSIVEPTVGTGGFTVQLDGSDMILTITDMQFEYSPGITVHLNYEGRTTIFLDSEHDVLRLAVDHETGSGSVEVSKGIEIAEIVLGVSSIVLALVGGFGGAVGRVASAAVESASAASLGAAEAGAEDADAAANATISCCRGLISGTPAELSQLAARCVTVVRVAAIGAFCTTLMPGITMIVQAVADGKYESMPKITDLTSSAVGKTVIWPETVGSFSLASAELAGAFQFGLKRDSIP